MTVMAKRFVLAALLLLATMGCAGYHKELDLNPAFSAHHFSYYDLGINWRAEQNGDTIRLSGTLANLRSSVLQDIELSARLVDKQGKVFARGSYTDFPPYLPPGKSEPFRLEFRIPPGMKAEQVRFSYYYFLAEDPLDFRGFDQAPHFGGFVSPP
jgi:hypothetical protein